MTERIRRFLREKQPETPCLVVDLDVVEDNYKRMRELLPQARIFYAMKANPAAEVLLRLGKLGSSFDTASRGEIEQVIGSGVDAARISFGNTIKKERDIAWAYQQGVRLYAFDSEAEMAKLARSAPGSRVFCRVLVDCGGAEWPLSRKFGCAPDMARELLRKAAEAGLDPYGVSFHVGSQQTDLEQWDRALAQVSQMFFALAETGIDLKMVNLGGGFPARYRADVQPIDAYCEAVQRALVRHFGNRMPEVIIEPGRSMVGDAGVIQSEVVLISRKAANDRKRWVYLDIGKFGGLPETIDEAIRYPLITPRDGDAVAPCV
ncbi:MAG: type III PLP-dependent enzyme, partial [Alphaproteobacteria bacterium]|nr:type III PLP-dependent enzyme [Alphaproteobacteria bacterium]